MGVSASSQEGVEDDDLWRANIDVVPLEGVGHHDCRADTDVVPLGVRTENGWAVISCTGGGKGRGGQGADIWTVAATWRRRGNWLTSELDIGFS
jgi:hypothetical protein